MNANDILPELPTGYRWANEIECDRWYHPTYFNKMVQISRELGTDLAIKTL